MNLRKFQIFALASFLALVACNTESKQHSETQQNDTVPNDTVATPTNNSGETARPKDIPNSSVEGDFDGDGKMEWMWLNKPQTKDESFGECEGECTCTIQFSNAALPPIVLTSCIGGQPVNEGDLDGDGSDEIGILPDWFTSCWRSYYVFRWSNETWANLVEPISTHCEQWENGVDVIEKSQDTGYVITRSMDMMTFELKEEQVKVR